MGVLNVTPDSFSDGGRFLRVDAAVNRALQMIEEGADIIDIGGESTGPGSKNVSSDEEINRILPVIEKLRPKFAGIISVDTYKSAVAEKAIKAGADMINDVLAGRGNVDDEKMFRLVAESGAGLVLMYSKDTWGRTSRKEKDYNDVCSVIGSFLRERLLKAQKNGVKLRQICLDPGMGAFISAKSEYSLAVLRNLKIFKKIGRPLLIGASRKGFISDICGGEDVTDRLEGSLAIAFWSYLQGVSLLRVHDVLATRRLLMMAEKIIE